MSHRGAALKSACVCVCFSRGLPGDEQGRAKTEFLSLAEPKTELYRPSANRSGDCIRVTAESWRGDWSRRSSGGEAEAAALHADFQAVGRLAARVDDATVEVAGQVAVAALLRRAAAAEARVV